MTRHGALAALALLAACAPSDPCASAYFQRLGRTSLPYAGEWVVAYGDTVTLPDGMGDRFKLTGFRLDTAKVVVGEACRSRGTMTFAVPAETLAITWFGEPERLYIFGWPAELGPFAGIGASWWGRDSLRGAILFDEQLGVQMPPGVTAEFVAARH